GPVVAARPHAVRDAVGAAAGGLLALREQLFTSHKARFREAAEIHHDLEQPLQSVQRAHALHEVGWESPEQRLELVALLHSLKSISRGSNRYRTTAGASAGSSTRTASSFTNSIDVAASRKPSDNSARATCSSY